MKAILGLGYVASRDGRFLEQTRLLLAFWTVSSSAGKEGVDRFGDELLGVRVRSSEDTGWRYIGRGTLGRLR